MSSLNRSKNNKRKISRNINTPNTPINKLSEVQEKNQHISENDITYLKNIADSLKNISIETQKKSYIKEYNIIHIVTGIITIIISSGTILGTAILFIYLKSINGINLLSQTLSNSNLFIFFIIFTILNLIIFIIGATPLYFIKRYNQKYTLNYLSYSIPSCYFLILVITYNCIENASQNVHIYIAIILYIIYLYCCLYQKNIKKIRERYSKAYKNQKKKRLYKNYIILKFEQIFIKLILITVYFMLTLIFSSEFIIIYNAGEHDYFYILYSILLPILIAIFSISGSNISLKRNYKKDIACHIFFIFIISTILLPLIIFVAIQAINTHEQENIESHYSDNIMIILDQQDKYDKIYYIEENFIKTNLEPTALIIETENHKTKNTSNEDIEYNKYIAHCGKIYLDTGNKTVFKRWNSDNFVQIPTNKIFEYQGRTLTCDIIKLRDNLIQVISLIQHKNH